jgi:hypothetical protein
VQGSPKDFILEKLDLIRGALYMMTRETSPTLIIETLHLLESCLYYESENLPRKLRKWEKNGEEVGVNPEWALALNVRWLTYMFSSDGENIILSLRDRFDKNAFIIDIVNNFEWRYINLELDQLEAF